MIHVYAITEALSPEAPLPSGIDDQPLEFLTHGGFSAALTRHAAGAPDVTAQNVWRHERVVESLMARAPVLPVRFGVRFEHDEALIGVLAANSRALANALTALRGHVELGINVLGESFDERREPAQASPPLPAADKARMSGRQYMEYLLNHQTEIKLAQTMARKLAAELDARLAPLATRSTHQILANRTMLLSAAYLVERERTTEFDDALKSLAALHPEVRIVGTGPWPPYHFTPALTPVRAVAQ